VNSWLAVISASVAVLMAAVSLPSSAFLSSAERALDRGLLVALTLVALLRSSFSVWYTSVSALLRTSASSRRLAVLLGVGLGVLHHLVDVVLVERATDR
jgi:hypothetical protein